MRVAAERVTRGAPLGWRIRRPLLTEPGGTALEPDDAQAGRRREGGCHAFPGDPFALAATPQPGRRGENAEGGTYPCPMAPSAGFLASAHTARWIAAVRERESARPDRLFDDPWAGALAGDPGRLAMQASERASGGRNDFIPVRTRFFEDLITDESAVVDQVVLLGAGLDTRAFRLHLPPDFDWFEIDDADLLADKDAALAAAGALPRCRRRAVAADLAGEWEPALLGAGFRRGERTLWIAEGLFFYLAPQTVASLLRATVALSGAGSAIAVDVSGTGLLRLPGMARYLEALAARGAAAPFCTNDPGALFLSAGWRKVELAEPGRLAAEYGRPLSPAPEPASRVTPIDPTMRTFFCIGRTTRSPATDTTRA